jgi:hypothetical protein
MMKRFAFPLFALSLVGSTVANAQSAVSAQGLQAEFEANNLRAETTYSGHTYDVSGTFKSAETGMFGSGVSVTMVGHNQFISGFSGTLAEGEDKTAMNLNKRAEHQSALRSGRDNYVHPDWKSLPLRPLTSTG